MRGLSWRGARDGRGTNGERADRFCRQGGDRNAGRAIQWPVVRLLPFAARGREGVTREFAPHGAVNSAQHKISEKEARPRMYTNDHEWEWRMKSWVVRQAIDDL